MPGTLKTPRLTLALNTLTQQGVVNIYPMEDAYGKTIGVNMTTNPKYYDECPDFILDLMTGECMYQVGEFSCAVDRHDKCFLERREVDKTCST